MTAAFYFTPGNNFQSSSRSAVLDEGRTLLEGKVGQDSIVALGPASALFDAVLDDRIGLYDTGTNSFFPAFGGASAAALTPSSGGYFFNFQGFTGRATVHGGRFGDQITGGSGNDTLYGHQGTDRLTGGDGIDWLDGGAGNDLMWGGRGNDTYVVDSMGDRVFEAVGEGDDTVIATASYTLRSGSEIETLRLAASTGSQALNLLGNEFSNTLVGNDGANKLDGKGGHDFMTGGKGNDIYYVDHWQDEALEAAGGGYDTVYASADHCFVDGQEIEVLRGNAGNKGLHLMGNELAQKIIGNTGNDIIHGDGGADVMTGRGGRDTFAFTARVDATPGSDRPTITDFAQGQDSIFLAKLQAVDGAATDQAFTWIGDAAFSGQAGELHQRALGASTLVEGDTNGDRVADIQIVLKGTLELQAGDFTL